MEIPAKKWISKSSSPVPEKIRGVLNNILDILVKVRGSGVKFRLWTPFDPTFGRDTCPIYGKMTQSKSSQTDFCDGLLNFKTINLRNGAFCNSSDRSGHFKRCHYIYFLLISHKKRGWCQKGVLEGVQ